VKKKKEHTVKPSAFSFSIEKKIYAIPLFVLIPICNSYMFVFFQTLLVSEPTPPPSQFSTKGPR
jgi:hypothetical protein